MSYYDEPPDEYPDPNACPRCHSDDCECCQECGAGSGELCGVECSEWKPPVSRPERIDGDQRGGSIHAEPDEEEGCPF